MPKSIRAVALTSLPLVVTITGYTALHPGLSPVRSWAGRKVTSLWAERHTCPVCGQRSIFAPFGDPPRPAAMCAVCGALERHRLLYLYLQDNTTLFSDKLSVLHFSPEPGLSATLKAKSNLTYATSWYEPDRPADFHLDLTNLAQPDASWDVVIAYHVFEHIPDDRTAMRELFRVVKPGGWAVLQVPLREGPDSIEDPTVETNEERDHRFGQWDHVRYYGWQDFADRLTEAGFDVHIERPGRELSDDAIHQYALSRDERIYIARKH
jgi:SAM-dependent methyltransferase